MSNRHALPFQPIDSTHTAFNSTMIGTATLSALEATGREWLSGPIDRSIALTESLGKDYNLAIGTSDEIATLAGHQHFLGGTVQVLRVQPHQTHISIISSTDTGFVNVTLGYGQ